MLIKYSVNVNKYSVNVNKYSVNHHFSQKVQVRIINSYCLFAGVPSDKDIKIPRYSPS